MDAADDWYRWEGDALLLKVHLQPRAAAEEIAGLHGGAMKIRLREIPTQGRANRRLTAYVAEMFGVPHSRVTLVAGAGSRRKLLRIRNPTRLVAGIHRP